MSQYQWRSWQSVLVQMAIGADPRTNREGQVPIYHRTEDPDWHPKLFQRWICNPQVVRPVLALASETSHVRHAAYFSEL